jgi:hypothetical protein
MLTRYKPWQHHSRQISPQAPQFSLAAGTSVPGMHGHKKQVVVVSAQTPAQQLLPAPHSASDWQPHFPFTQAPLFGQALPHAPQFCAELNGVSQPSAGWRLQSAKPVSHCIRPHVPFVH